MDRRRHGGSTLVGDDAEPASLTCAMTARIPARKSALLQPARSRGFAWFFVAAACGVLVIAAWQLIVWRSNFSPVALAVLFFYSYTKRFTSWSHLCWDLPGNVTGGAMDCHRGLARRADVDPVRSGDTVGRRLRRSLCLPGRRIRKSVICFPCRSASGLRTL